MNDIDLRLAGLRLKALELYRDGDPEKEQTEGPQNYMCFPVKGRTLMLGVGVAIEAKANGPEWVVATTLINVQLKKQIKFRWLTAAQKRLLLKSAIRAIRPEQSVSIQTHPKRQGTVSGLRWIFEEQQLVVRALRETL